jgi:hypothetical protein
LFGRAKGKRNKRDATRLKKPRGGEASRQATRGDWKKEKQVGV